MEEVGYRDATAPKSIWTTAENGVCIVVCTSAITTPKTCILSLKPFWSGDIKAVKNE